MWWALPDWGRARTIRTSSSGGGWILTILGGSYAVGTSVNSVWRAFAVPLRASTRAIDTAREQTGEPRGYAFPVLRSDHRFARSRAGRSWRLPLGAAAARPEGHRSCRRPEG